MSVCQAIYDGLTEDKRRAPGPLFGMEFDSGPERKEPELPNVDDVVIYRNVVRPACGGYVLVGSELVREKTS